MHWNMSLLIFFFSTHPLSIYQYLVDHSTHLALVLLVYFHYFNQFLLHTFISLNIQLIQRNQSMLIQLIHLILWQQQHQVVSVTEKWIFLRFKTLLEVSILFPVHVHWMLWRKLLHGSNYIIACHLQSN